MASKIRFTSKNKIKMGESETSEAVSTFLDRIEVAKPGTLESLVLTKEIKRPDEHGRVLFAQRMIRAEKHDVDKAVKRAIDHSVWRKQVLGPEGSIPDDHVREQLEEEKVFLQIETRSNRPLLFVQVRKHNPNKTDLEILKKFVVYSLETATYFLDNPEYGNPDGTMDVLFDIRGMTWANFDVAGLKSCFTVLAQAFPERIHKIYMLDAPYMFDMIWKIVKPFVDPVSREKVEFLHGDKGVETLKDAIGEEHLPQEVTGLDTRPLPIDQAMRKVTSASSAVLPKE